jgi:predicted secreted acid phosphatase
VSSDKFKINGSNPEGSLNNSAYQVWLDNTEDNYTEESWDEWVKSGRASLVLGAKAFIETVISKGGQDRIDYQPK